MTNVIYLTLVIYVYTYILIITKKKKNCVFDLFLQAGRNRAYALGTNLRKLYNNFLGNEYNSKEVGARSTDFDRTKMSLQLVMANLFQPSTGSQQWNPNLNWQPTVVNYVPGFLDAMMSPHECPK